MRLRRTRRRYNWPRIKKLIVKLSAASVKFFKNSNSRGLNKTITRKISVGGDFFNELKYHRHYRVMSKGPIAKKKKSLVYLGKGTTQLRVFFSGIGNKEIGGYFINYKVQSYIVYSAKVRRLFLI